jgi:hypothetical protein
MLPDIGNILMRVRQCESEHATAPAAVSSELADHSLGLVVESGDNLVGVLFCVAKSPAAEREIDDFMTVPRSLPG